MTKDTNSTDHTMVSYTQVEEAFTQEASSLISLETIQAVLQTEKRCFENAAALKISASKFVGYNTARHCKDLVRSRQPFPALYIFLCFLTELASLLFPYSILLALVTHIAKLQLPAIFTSFPYVISIFIAITLCNDFKKHILLKQLCQNAIDPKDSTAITQAKKKLHISFGSLYAVILLLLICVCAGLHFSGIAFALPVTLTYGFIFYVACMILSGIHNVIYSGHAISFFTIGICLVSKQPEEKVQSATAHYLAQRFEQMLSLSGKTTANLSENAELQKKLCASVYSHMVTQRIYDILAIIILLAIDIVCLTQFRALSHLPMLLFFILSCLLTLILCIALISVRHIMKCTKE